MNKEFFNGNNGNNHWDAGTSGGQHAHPTFYTQEDFGLKINEGSLTEPSFFSPVFSKPHLDIYSSNRYLDTFLFHRSTFL